MKKKYKVQLKGGNAELYLVIRDYESGKSKGNVVLRCGNHNTLEELKIVLLELGFRDEHNQETLKLMKGGTDLFDPSKNSLNKSFKEIDAFNDYNLVLYCDSIPQEKKIVRETSRATMFKLPHHGCEKTLEAVLGNLEKLNSDGLEKVIKAASLLLKEQAKTPIFTSD